MRFIVNSSERMRIHSSGNIGIGTTTALSGPSSATALRIGNQINIYEYDDGSNPVQMNINQNIDANENYITTDYAARYQMRDGVHKWFTVGSGTAGNATSISSGEAMRIDSSGNVLVSTTDISVYNNSAGTTADNGINLRADGKVDVARYNGAPFGANRTGSDGIIADFRKDGTTVGSIGTISSYLTIGSGVTGLLFDDISGKSIRPWNLDSNTASDADTDLGISSQRFKDLYLSGGVYVGGTGSANYLDDYEEGTWTPSLPSGWINLYGTGRYTKIGNIVHLTWVYRNSAAGSTGLTATLPFASANTSYNENVSPCRTYGINITGVNGTNVSAYIGKNSTSLSFDVNSQDGANTALTNTHVSGGSDFIWVNMHYIVA